MMLKKQKGITIVEALVAMVILSLGLIPALAVITSSTNITTLIKNNLIAANLTQEGIEVVHSLRDENWFLNKTDFYDDIIGTWRVDWNTNWTTNPPVPTTIGSDIPIKFDSVTGIYGYNSGEDTIFSRTVNVALSSNPCNCELVVVSEVTWIARGQTRMIQAESRLYNWR